MGNDSNQLARLDERMNHFCERLDDVDETLKAIFSKLDDKYVTNGEFGPVQKIVYGAVALVLTTVVGGLVTFLIQGGLK